MREVTSTSVLARRLLAQGGLAAPCLVSAWEQTAGRGRRGNRWHGTPGGGVYATLAFPLPAATALSVLPLATAAALCSSIDERIGPACRIKWPNDLLIDGRKVGGVLIEAVASSGGRWALVGFGVNVHKVDAMPAATWLGRYLASPADPASLTVELALALLDSRTRFDRPEKAIEAFRALSAHRRGERLSYRDADGSIRSGRFAGLDDRGYLRLSRGGREMVLTAAELVE